MLKGFPSRPTTDFAKENIFNVLHNTYELDGLAVLDLFAGTGSISYEFASRGCKVVSVEKDFKSVEFIKTSIKKLGAEELITAYKSDVFRYIEKTTNKFDLVFADPPYDLENLDKIPEKVFSADIIHPEGWLVLEHGKNIQFNGNQNLIDTRTYGSVHFSIFEKK